MNISRQIFTRVVTTAAVATLVACGGGGGGGGSGTTANPTPADPAPTATGSVGILLTDAPSDRFDKIVVTITGVELIGGSERVTVFDGSEDVDLKSLEQFSELFAVEDDVPVGTYRKIRLYVERVQLIELDEDGNVEEKIDADVPANGKIDLLDRTGFEVTADSSLIVQLDIDAKKSIKVQGTGSGRYKFRPVVFVEVIDDEVRGRLVRVSGVVDEVEEEDGEREIELCPLDDDEYEVPCLDVLVGDDTSIFDGNAEPVDFSSIQEGDELTAIGYLADEDDVDDDYYGYGGDDARREDDDDDDDDYDDDRDDDCDDDYDDDRYDDRYDDRDEDCDDDGRHDFDDDVVLLAEVIELGPRGTFAVIEGEVTESLDEASGEFALEVFPGQGLGDMTTLAAVLQTGGKIFSADGTRLPDSAVTEGTTGSFDGVLSLSDTDPDVLKTVLGILDIELDDEVLRGIIQTVDEDEESFILATGLGDRCVDADDADIFLVEVTDDGIVSNRGDIGDLMAGMAADVFGEEDGDGCFDADAVIAELGSDDTEPPPVDDENNAPEADAGEDQEATVGETVTLDGSDSFDPDGDTLTYAWSFDEIPEGSSAELIGPDGPVTTFVPDVPGEYKARLVVSDGELDDDDGVEVEVSLP